MNIQKNASLKEFNTFGIDKKAEFFIQVTSVQEVIQALKEAKKMNLPVFILGGGSNILLTRDIPGLVLKMCIKGFDILREDEKNVWVRVGAGEIWHDFVQRAIASDLAGVENLSLIPGTVGASPMQNIGAYGAEIQEVFDSLEAIDLQTFEKVIFDHSHCAFGYRESIFKNSAKNKYIITRVIFKLNKIPEFNISYGALQATLKEMGVEKLSLESVSKAVIQVRKSKLPDPAIIGNAGSFFKNPTIPISQFESLKKKYEQLPGYPNDNGVKVPAAWLLEKAGWKGKTFGDIGVHKHQPLVLVNYGKGDGLAIKELSEQIQNDILEKFGIHLHPEVNFV